MFLWKIKLKAFLIHLAISVILISIFLLVVSKIWFPGPLFQLEGVWQGLKILIPVDAILGPLLTLILFVPGKKGLKLDLSVVAGLQIAALIYGGSLIYQQRPVAFAFVIDRFEVILASNEYWNDLPQERFKNNNHSFPLMTYVLPAQNREEKNQFILNFTDIKKLTERHYPLDKYMDKIIEKSLKLHSLTPSNEKSKQLLNDFVKANKESKELLLLPLQASTLQSAVIVINSKTGEFVEYINIDPWETNDN